MSRGTVAAAYELLRRDGLLDSRQGSGAYVRRAGRPVGAAAARANLVYRGHLEPPQVGIDLAGAALPAAEEVLAAAAGPDAPLVTVGSASKTFWGGLRVGWLRAPEPLIAQAAARHSEAGAGGHQPSGVAAASPV